VFLVSSILQNISPGFVKNNVVEQVVSLTDLRSKVVKRKSFEMQLMSARLLRSVLAEEKEG